MLVLMATLSFAGVCKSQPNQIDANPISDHFSKEQMKDHSNDVVITFKQVNPSFSYTAAEYDLPRIYLVKSPVTEAVVFNTVLGVPYLTNYNLYGLKPKQNKRHKPRLVCYNYSNNHPVKSYFIEPVRLE